MNCNVFQNQNQLKLKAIVCYIIGMWGRYLWPTTAPKNNRTKPTMLNSISIYKPQPVAGIYLQFCSYLLKLSDHGENYHSRYLFVSDVSRVTKV